MKKVVLFVAGCACGLLLWLLTRPSGSASAEPRLAEARTLADRFAAARELRLRLHASAAPPQVESLRRLAETGPNIRRKVLEEHDFRWASTVLTIDDLGFDRAARRRCADEGGKGIEDVCAFAIEMGVERTSSAEGRIGLAQVKVEDGSDPLCHPYAECLARARVGRMVPLPAGDGERAYGLSQRIFASPLPAEQRRPDTLRRDLASLRIDLEENRQALARMPADDAAARQLAFHVESNARLIAFMEGWLAELEAPPVAGR